MHILQSAKTLMKISGILPIFANNFRGKCFEKLKLLLILSGPIYVVISTFAFSVVHFDDLRLLTTSLYISVGTAMAVLAHGSLCCQTGKVERLLEDIGALVNESEYTVICKCFRINKTFFSFPNLGITSSAFGVVYYETDAKITKIIKRIARFTCIVVFILASGPFAGAFLDYLKGNYNSSSWQLMYDTLYV